MNELNHTSMRRNTLPVIELKLPEVTEEMRADHGRLQASKAWVRQMIGDGFMFVYRGPHGDAHEMVDPDNYSLKRTAGEDDADKSYLLLNALSYQFSLKHGGLDYGA